MKIVSLVFMILGCFLGAGFVSGKEVATYFSVFGKYSILGILILGVLIFLLLSFFLYLSNKVENFKEFIDKYFGKKSGILTFLFSFSMLIFIGSMFAGNLVLAENFYINKFILIIVTSFLTFVFVTGKSKRLSAINIFIMPIIIFVLIYLSFSLKWGNYRSGNVGLSVFSSISYVFINIVPLGVFLIDLKFTLSKKEIVLTSLITTLVIVFLLTLYNNAIIINNISDMSMPIIVLANKGGTLLKILTFASLYLGLLTTLVSCVFVFSNYVNGYLNNYKHSTMLSIFLGLIISFFGFDAIVSYVYVLIGLIGFYLVFSVIVKEKRNLKNQVSNEF